MAPPCLQSIHHFVLVAAAASILSMLVVTVGAAEAPSGSGSCYTSMPASATTTVRYDKDEYLMEFKIGGSLVSGIVDTGSDLTWTNNSQSVDSKIACDLQRASYLTSTKNSQLVDSKIELVDPKIDCDDPVVAAAAAAAKCRSCWHGNCMFKRKYAEGSEIIGLMATAKLTLGETTPDCPIIIGSAVTLDGCSSSSTSPDNKGNKRNCELYGSGGIVGLSRGSQSLVEQLHLRGFYYCLNRDKASRIVFLLPSQQQPPPQLPTSEAWKSTPLVDIKQGTHSGSYYVELKKISIGKKALDIPEATFKMNQITGNKGMIIDSGFTYTSLPKGAFAKVTQALEKHMEQRKRKGNSKNSFCFEANKDDADGLLTRMPNMVLHFAGGAEMVLPAGNYMRVVESSAEVCLAMTEAQKNHNLADTFILGNFQQHNIAMGFNLTTNMLWFTMPGECDANMHAAA